MSFWWIVVAFVVGGWFGAGIMACMNAAGRYGDQRAWPDEDYDDDDVEYT